MGNVWDAMKKHRAERAEQAPSAPPEQAPQTSQAGDQAKPPEAERLPTPSAPAPGTQTGVLNIADDGHPYSPLLVPHHDRGGPLTEEYRALRTSLLAQNPDGRFCYLVTSAEASEGKTVTCLNLGLVMAERVDRRTVIVDFDLRRSRVARLLEQRQSPGVSDLLSSSKTLDECVCPTRYPNLFVLPAGDPEHAKVGELMGRPDVHDVMGELRRDFDYVIVDTPPLNAVSDAGVIGHAVGEALLVVRMNKTSYESADKAVRLLHAANVELAGIILTHRKHHRSHYSYKYKYKYRYKD